MEGEGGKGRIKGYCVYKHYSLLQITLLRTHAELTI